MTEFVDSHPTARKRHRCGVCHRVVMPGEEYWRQAGFDGTAWTNKTCAHCERVIPAYLAAMGDHEWEPECLVEWVQEARPDLYAWMQAGWRWPDGELAPLPYGSRCHTCRTRIPWRHLWCGPCDAARINHLNQQFTAISHEFEKAGAS